MGSKRKNYKSVAYTDVVLYAVQTAGGGLDNDTELYMWTSAQRHKVEFSAKKVDVFEIYQFMNRKVAQAKMKLRQLQGQQHHDFIDPVPPNMDKKYVWIDTYYVSYYIPYCVVLLLCVCVCVCVCVFSSFRECQYEFSVLILFMFAWLIITFRNTSFLIKKHNTMITS